MTPVSRDDLYKLYVTNRKSIRQIAAIYSCPFGKIYYLLNKYEIPVRDLSCAQKNRGSKYALLNDKGWLFEQYTNKKRTCKSIAIEAGIRNGKEGCVVKALKKFGIPVRDRHTTRIYNRDSCGFKLDHDLIDGTLLGDAYLEISDRKSKRCHTRYVKKNKHYQHVLWVAKQLFAYSSQKRIFPDPAVLNGKKFMGYKLRSLNHVELDYYYRRWYPKSKNYKKSIPPDVSISPKTLLHWFLDDGTSWLNKKTGDITLYFCTHGFKFEELVPLSNRITNKYGIAARVNSSGKNAKNKGYGFYIRICKNDIPKFYSIIGPPPVKCLAYKWKYAHNYNQGDVPNEKGP